jgi:hypothetical protein
MTNAIADHKRGDTWDGMSFLCEELQEDGTYLPVNLTGFKVFMELRTSPDSIPVLIFSTDTNTITVPEPFTGEIIFPERKITIPFGEYLIDIYIIPPDGDKETIVTDRWKIVYALKK